MPSNSGEADNQRYRSPLDPGPLYPHATLPADPLRESYDVISDDPELQVLSVIVQAMERHLFIDANTSPDDREELYAARNRVGEYLRNRYFT